MIEEKNEYYRSLAERIVKDVQENPCELNGEITREIEKIDRRKPILLVGKDKKLIKHAVNWIHLTHPKVYRHVGRNVSLLARYSDNPISPVISSIENRTIILSEYSCIGKTEQKIEDDLFSPDCSFISDYKSGEMLFVRGLNSKRILERLADSVEPSGSGVLIVNVPGMDIVPQELKDQIIEIEPEKQDIPASTPQDTTNVQGVTTFPLPPGAEVSDIEIAFLDEQTVRVYIKGQSKVFNFAEIGFLNRKTGKPNKLWLELSLYVDGNGITNQKDSERINTTLQSFFKTKQGLLNRTQTFFKIRRQTKSDNNKPTRGVFRECPVCKDRHKNYCSVCKVETEHCHECHDELYNHAKLNS